MLNRVILMGRLTADPELRKTASDLSVTSFTLAVDRNYGKGADRQTDFINCVAWRQTAEFISRYFYKGNMIAVDGQIQTRSWDGQDGKRQYATEVVIDNAYFTGSKGESSGAGTQASYQTNFGYQHSENRPAPQPQHQQPADDGFVDLDFANDMGSEDDLPF